jgi:hypothetical protein
LLVTPLQPGSGGADPRFNRKPYGKRVFYLRLDQSLKRATVQPDGTALDAAGLLFKSGPGTVWGKETPEVHPPE